MPYFLNQRCILALCMAIWLASLFALIVWGPVQIPSNGRLPFFSGFANYSDVNSIALPLAVREPLIWAGLAIFCLSIWGQYLFMRSRRATDVRWPWQALLLTVASTAFCWIFQVFNVTNYSILLQHFSQAGMGVFLFFGLILECFEICWVGVKKIALGCAFLFGFGMICTSTALQSEVVDARFILLLQILPLLLMFAGALLQTGGRVFCRSEVLFICSTYTLIMFGIWLPCMLPMQSTSFFDNIFFESAWVWFVLLLLCVMIMVPISRGLQFSSRRHSHEFWRRENISLFFCENFKSTGLTQKPSKPVGYGVIGEDGWTTWSA